MKISVKTQRPHGSQGNAAFSKRMIFPRLCAIALTVVSSISYADTAGRLLVSSHDTDEVFRFDEADGSFIDVMVSAGSGGLNAPHGLAFGPDRNLYVGSAGNDRILRYNGETGAFIDTFVTNGSGGLDYPAGILFGPDGHLYVASQFSDEILRYHGLTGAFIDAFVAAGSGGLDDPSVPVFGPDSNLYVTGRSDHRVYRYHGGNGSFLNVFVTNMLSQPFGCAFGPDGNFYVASGNENVIRRFSGMTGEYLNDFVATGLSFPVQFIFGPDTNMYVCNYVGDTVTRYRGTNGAALGAFVTAGNGGINGPNFLTFRPAGSGPLDRDGDGMTDADEIIAGTWPVDSGDYFRVTGFGVESGAAITFRAATGRVYSIQLGDPSTGSWSNHATLVNLPATGTIHTVVTEGFVDPMQAIRVDVSIP